jgi:arylsulfatase A-like enzyme
MTPLTRREMLSLSATGLLGTALAARPARAAQPKEGAMASKPNVLVILVDDLGYGDLACYGAPDLQTPHLDRLADQGIKFSNAYANCPVCSPTRAALLTGRYQEMVGVPGVIRTHPRNSWGHLIPDARLLPVQLHPAGYTSAIVGKWHLGLQPPNIPTERGFDVFHGFLGDMMDDYYTHRRHGHNYMRKGTETIDPKGHATDLFTQWACDWLCERKPGQPFFLYLAYNAPHTPIQPPKPWLDRVRKRQPKMSPRRAKLAALIEHMDNGIGKVLTTLEETGLAENTLVIFASDNGGQLGVGARNGPLRDGKGSVYEGGVRVPMIARWPGRIAPGTTTDRIALSMDIFPTVCQAAGAAIEHEIDGVSFLPALLGKDRPQLDRDLFFGRREGGKFKGGRIEAIRRGDWKLLRPMPGADLELYNLAEDPREQHDLADEKPEKFKELADALQAQLDRYAKVPWKPPGRK